MARILKAGLALLLVLGYFALDRFVLGPDSEPIPSTTIWGLVAMASVIATIILWHMSRSKRREEV